MHTRLLAASAATLLAGSLLTTPAHASDDGWAHLAPWAAATPQAYGYYGRQVALGGGYAFVSHDGTNAVEVRRLVDGVFVDTQVLPSPFGPAALDAFGSTLVLGDDELFVSAYLTANEISDTGVVYAYRLVDGQWVASQTIQAPFPIPQGRFGMTVATDADWLAVSTRETVGVDAYDARVFVYRHVDGAWQYRYVINGLDNGDGIVELALRARDGQDLADLFVAMGSSDGPDDMLNAGLVDHYLLTENSPFAGPKLHPASLQHLDRFGASVAFDGEQLFVGASGVNGFGPADGAVYVFDVDTEPFLPTIDEVDLLTGGAIAENARFGSQLALDGDRLVVGGRFGDEDGVSMVGHTYTFRREIFGPGWELEHRLAPANLAPTSLMGSSVAIDGDHVLSGGTTATGGGVANAGAAYLFSLTSSDLPGGQAPADVLAMAEAYGPTDGPELSATVLPVPGETTLVGVKPVQPGTVPVVAYGLAPAEIPFSGTQLVVADPQLLILPPAGQFGQIGVVWDVPAEPLLAGVQVYVQVLLADALPAQSVQATNGLELTVGY